VGLALLVRTLCWLPAASHPERFLTDDAGAYVALARDLHAGYLDPQSPAFPMGLLRTPVYPGFLAPLLRLFDGSLHAIVAVQIGISLLTVWLTWVLALRLIGPRTALASALLLALDPASALFSCLLQPEALFAALLVAGAVFWRAALERGACGPAIAAGLLLGAAALTRPIGLFLPLCLAPAVWLRRPPHRPARLLLCFLLASAVPLAAWVAKNQVLTGFPFFSTVGDSSLFYYRAAGALAEDERISLDEARTRLSQQLLAQAPPATSFAELSSRQRALALQVLAEHPWGAMKMMSAGVLRMLAGTGLTAFSRLLGDPDPESVSRPWQRAVQALQLLVLALAYLAVARGIVLLAVRREGLAIALPLGIAAYLVLFSAGPEANTRFRVPAAPFLAILAGHGLSQPFARSRRA
jgi:4-amino-4-deoxy-L-arabinose transferase-like glycosyltransferase